MADLDGEKLRAAIEYYKTIISVQTHFNDMLIRTRWFGLTVIATLTAVSGATLSQTPDSNLSFIGVDFHISGLFAACGILVCLGLFLLDRVYYYRLLMSAVRQGADFERENAEMFKTIGVSNSGLTQNLSVKVPKLISDGIVLAYWSIPAVVCIVLAMSAIR